MPTRAAYCPPRRLILSALEEETGIVHFELLCSFWGATFSCGFKTQVLGGFLPSWLLSRAQCFAEICWQPECRALPRSREPLATWMVCVALISRGWSRSGWSGGCEESEKHCNMALPTLGARLFFVVVGAVMLIVRC